MEQSLAANYARRRTVSSGFSQILNPSPLVIWIINHESWRVGYAIVQLVETLIYMPESRGFDFG